MNKSESEISQTSARQLHSSAAVLNKHDVAPSSKVSAIPPDIIQNDLLSALPADELACLLPYLELVQLPLDKELYQHGERINYVYFPCSAIVASLFMRIDGSQVEIGVTGHEGLVGSSIVMSDRAIGTARVQCAGSAYKLKACILNEASDRLGSLHGLLMRYLHASISNIALTAAFKNHSSVDEKLARWLLDRLDRSASNILTMTQEMIAAMLCVRRESITEAANKLRSAGFIRYLRGTIVVLDRNGLEAIAGESYTMSRQEFDLILSDPHPAPPKNRFVM